MEYIANEVIKNQLYIDDSSFFQLPYIISIIDNVNKNNYTYTSSTKDNLVTSIYNIEYKSFMEKKIVTFITYYDIEKQLLNYEIPSQLNYNSLDQAIVYVQKNSNNYNYNLLIPKSFYLLDSSDFLLMIFNVTGLIVNSNLLLHHDRTNCIEASYNAIADPIAGGDEGNGI